MKQFKIAALVLLLSVSAGYSQSESNPWAIGIGVNAVDFYPMGERNREEIGQFVKDYFTIGNYNMIPSFSRLSVARYLKKGFSVEAVGTINKISKYGPDDASTPGGHTNGDYDDEVYFAIDLAARYDLNILTDYVLKRKWFNPYALAGLGYTHLGDTGEISLNLGGGINFWITDNVAINVDTKLKHTFGDKYIADHFQHGLGIVLGFGGKDTDGDKIMDEDDACPTVFGLKEFNGCPDTDGDGIEDSKDGCPNEAGKPELNGCPDTDGDGIADKNDSCPNEKGIAATNGCPDSDSDGVVDSKDGCPNVAGPSANRGCPWPDTDGDGVLDKDDNCVNQAGPASNRGCPQISQEEEAKLGELFKTVYFDTGKDSFKDETYASLDQAISIISKYSTAKFAISGYTDSVGKDENNLRLSEERAQAVKSYLISKGISGNNLTARGFGEASPIASNKTRDGRSQNRRVEIKLVK